MELKAADPETKSLMFNAEAPFPWLYQCSVFTIQCVRREGEDRLIFHLTFLALHPAVAVLAVLAVVAPVPGQAVAVLLQGLAPMTVQASHPALRYRGLVQ